MTTTNPSAPYFDKVAGQWDELRSGYFNEAVREAAIRKAYLHPDMVVADVGAGTGFMASGLARWCRKCMCWMTRPGCLKWRKRTWNNSRTWNTTWRMDWQSP